MQKYVQIKVSEDVLNSLGYNFQESTHMSLSNCFSNERSE